MPDINLKVVPVAQIEAFAEEMASTQSEGGVVPISLSRARAWAHNPRALPDDPALLVAFSGNRCVGHLGMYPDVLHVDGRQERFFWLSILFVHPEFRAGGVGAMLLMRAMSLKQHLANVQSTAQATALYRALHFFEPAPLRFPRLFVNRLNLLGAPLRLLRRCAKAAVGRESTLLNGPIDLTQSITRRCLYPVLAHVCDRLSSRIWIEPLTEVSDGLMQPPSTDPTPQFDRGAEFFNWMLRYPWVSTNPRDSQKNNFFDDFRESFNTQAMRVCDCRGGETMGVLVIRTGAVAAGSVLRVLGFSASGPAGTMPLMAAILGMASKCQPDIIELPEGLSSDLERAGAIRKLFGYGELRFFFHARRGDNAMAGLLSRLQLHYCDGDYAFT